jgi:hypothetical protein
MQPCEHLRAAKTSEQPRGAPAGGAMSSVGLLLAGSVGGWAGQKPAPARQTTTATLNIANAQDEYP